MDNPRAIQNTHCAVLSVLWRLMGTLHRFRESFNQKLHYLPVEPLPCQFVIFKVRVWSVWFFLPSACGLVTSSAKSGQYDGVRATSSFSPQHRFPRLMFSAVFTVW